MNDIILYLPNDFCDLLMVSTNEPEIFDGMIAINQASGQWLQGQLDTGTYFDILDHFGIDPFAFVHPVEEFAATNRVTLDLLP
ncbi:MAG: hypothetical protein QNJ47_28135 [Nostocaceae cyanobacterium]|nr:hypothetical protein [Nostocaceae cyanobacterium]